MIVCDDPSIHRHGYSFDLILLLEGATDIIPERFTLTFSLDNDTRSASTTPLDPLSEPHRTRARNWSFKFRHVDL